MKKIIALFIAFCLAFVLVSCQIKGNDTNTDTSTSTSSETNNTSDSSTADNSIVPKSNDDKESEQSVEGFILKGKVIAYNTHLEIEVVESDYAFGVYHVIVPQGTQILNKSGEQITPNELLPNDIVSITYNGQTMLSYPPQIVALSIKQI